MIIPRFHSSLFEWPYHRRALLPMNECVSDFCTIFFPTLHVSIGLSIYRWPIQWRWQLILRNAWCVYIYRFSTATDSNCKITIRVHSWMKRKKFYFRFFTVFTPASNKCYRNVHHFFCRICYARADHLSRDVNLLKSWQLNVCCRSIKLVPNFRLHLYRFALTVTIFHVFSYRYIVRESNWKRAQEKLHSSRKSETNQIW